ncbi:unnamed protein product [Phytophthora lilii]|uniref:Unnamed protein product n=1 Tax=Phytophthora lilii TaxID=2077276 RepID=A0A9W7CGF2_9STRA|nr:unnamed protein product [Phytophthora lilii]
MATLGSRMLPLLLLLLLLLGTAGAMDGPVTADSVNEHATDVQPGQKPPLARTYRTAYGTSFECASTWTLILGAYVVLVVGGLLLLSVVPVRFASSEKLEAPFVLWFGSPNKKTLEAKQVAVEQQEDEEEVKAAESVQVESWWQRWSSWVEQTVAALFPPSQPRDIDVRYRFQADMTQQLAAATPKTYESIAVATDDLEEVAAPSPPVPEKAAEVLPPVPEELSLPAVELVPPPQELSSPPLIPELEAKAPLLPQSVEEEEDVFDVEPPRSRRGLARAASRSSIFMAAPPSPPSVSRARQGSARLASDVSSTKAESIGRITSRAGSGGSAVETKEDFVRAASRRQSMAVRAEKRVALAQEDVSYENLGDDEIRMYEYLEFIRELLDGLALKKVCQKSGRIVSRTLYITPDMTVVFWNATGTFRRLTAKSSIQTANIEEVLRGLHGSANVTARSTPERDAQCVSIRCNDGKWLVLEAKTEAMRQRLFLGFSRLAQEKHEQESETADDQAIPESREEEETIGTIARETRQTEATTTISKSRKQVVSTYETSGFIKNEASFIEKRADQVAQETDYEEKPPPPFLEIKMPRQELLSIRQQHGEFVAEQVELEETGPSPQSLPSLEETLLQRELSIRASYESSADEDQKVVETKVGGQHREGHIGTSLHGMQDPIYKDEETKEDELFQEGIEEEKEADKEEEKKVDEKQENDADIDIDNLSDDGDPEMSRE